MAYDFGSDILVDAMRAADPTASTKAMDRLERLARTTESALPTSEKFETALQAAPTKNRGNMRASETLQKFEAAVLTTFVQAMMPKEAASVFGEGFAGDMWKAQMAEKLADQIAGRGGIGIASRLLSDYRIDGDTIAPIKGVKDPEQVVDISRSDDAATRILHEAERDILIDSKRDLS